MDRRDVRRLAKHVLALASAPGLAAIRAGSRLAHGPTVRVFGYHRVVEDVVAASATSMPPLAISVRAFAAHLDHLARRYEVLPLLDALAVLRGARRPPRRDVAVITFDDGYRDVLDHAAPLLARRGLPATMFVPTGPIADGRPLPHDRLYGLLAGAARARLRPLAVPAEGPRWPLARADHELGRGALVEATDALLHGWPPEAVDAYADALAARVGEPATPALLDWDGVRALRRAGVDVGAHGVSHALLPHLDDQALGEELAASRAAIAHHVGTPPLAIAYPCGRYDDRVLAAARRAGYVVGVTTEDRPNRRGGDPLLFGRKVLGEAHSRGVGPAPSRALVAAQLDGLFAALGFSRACPGDVAPAAPWTP